MPELTKEDLKKHSYSYHHDHGISESDVKKANHLAKLIVETSNREQPMPGDIMICKGPGKVYKNGYVGTRNLSNYSSVCTEPYVPFVCSSLDTMFKDDYPEELSFSASGGYWFSIPNELRNTVKYIGKRKKVFKAWGHCGPTANGAFYFVAEVNVWEYFSDDIY